ncbi:M48 family metallopeptidase [Pseudoxanthomonas sacheonensis]|uniref:Zn-dependent protease with chaperone function n=1 Tax=Pseudoxanthomonas sacheonensis TaxID=443615 RepID=A0ABU1RTD8_9GAMM|nr:M48 family metallopeptidase [Pseudoxanthomonas sacheonensis]MDR6842035.1 Zn-dependent protease with chaperone function [Pseudoxanthomonas sacheonensis]
MQSAQARRRLVERLEREAEQAPGRYLLKLALLAALGYAVLAATLLSTLGALAFMLLYLLVVRPAVDPYMAFPLVVLGVASTVVLRALWIRFVLPEGHELQADEAPELRAEVERVRKEVGAASLHGIVINRELNAAAAFVPRGLGLWGQRHYLILGLPLLQTLDRRELAAVVAHEFGHFHGGHGDFSGWIYRLRLSWHRLLEGMAGGGVWGGQLLWVFFRWYAPYFEAYSQVLARRQEYAADAVAAQVAGADAAASALVRIELASDWMQGEFWPEVRQLVRGQSYPPIAVHTQLAEQLLRELRRDARLPAGVLTRQPALEDTHPTLLKRIAAMQAEPRQFTGEAVPASGLLGELDARLQQRFSLEWRKEEESDWKARYQQAQRERARLAELEAHPTHTPGEAVELACLAEDYQPGVDALPLYQAALLRAPSHGHGHFRLGALLLKRDRQEEGLQHLQRAMELDPALIDPSLRALDAHARGQPQQSPLHATLESLHTRYAASAGQAQSSDTEALQPHALDAAQLRVLARTLRGYDKVRQAWVVRRPLSGLEVLPHYLVLLDWAGSVASERGALPRIASQLQLPGSCTVLSAASDAEQARAIRSSAGEPAYRRP